MAEPLPSRRVTPLWVHATRVLLGMIFFTAGVSKLVPGFPGIIGPVWLIERLEPYGLGLFARFTAWSELFVGVLLMSGRFATLGAVMLLPMLGSILVVTISLGWSGTPYVNGVLLLLNVAILLYDYPKWRPLVARDGGQAQGSAAWGISRTELAWFAALAVLLASLALVTGPAGMLYLVALSGLVVLGLRAVERRAG